MKNDDDEDQFPAYSPKDFENEEDDEEEEHAYTATSSRTSKRTMDPESIQNLTAARSAYKTLKKANIADDFEDLPALDRLLVALHPLEVENDSGYKTRQHWRTIVDESVVSAAGPRSHQPDHVGNMLQTSTPTRNTAWTCFVANNKISA